MLCAILMQYPLIQISGGIMSYEVEWTEIEDQNFRRVFGAKDIPALWTAIKYMNMERRENSRPVMEQIRIKSMKKYDSAFSDIVGRFNADMALDAEERMA